MKKKRINEQIRLTNIVLKKLGIDIESFYVVSFGRSVSLQGDFNSEVVRKLTKFNPTVNDAGWVVLEIGKYINITLT
jgi:hypothetical protein